ncbi:DUF3617 domain-containing protein [Sphingomicrobium flavum]|uniref:DUF3617 domain-containing protein n=1 Tax=Sphingomicrobium flavum TaxID=1229164 RepID=UPI0021ADB13A|nr:DUF3617 domain-containing protein [Sphingomicrobium flavum]
MNTKILLIGAASLAIAACGDTEGAAPVAKEEPAAKAEMLSAGLYEVSVTADAVASTDGTTPAASMKEGDNASMQVCVGEEGAATLALYREAQDDCTAQRPYVRPGRMQVEMRCDRAGLSGDINARADGTYTEDSFEAEVKTTTYLTGSGDYAMSRTITGRRVGDCPSEG